MEGNIAFIGGIHGVGKSSICKLNCIELNIEYLSASKVIKWGEINSDIKDKKVDNIIMTQDLLMVGLSKYLIDKKYYLLDGHYCLLNSKNEISDVPFDTFRKMNLISLNIILGEISEIKMHLELRDGKIYDYNLLEKMQYQELLYARKLSKSFGINLNIGSQNEYSEIIDSVSKSIIFQTNNN